MAMAKKSGKSGRAKIDLSRASPAELNKIQSAVTRRLATEAFRGGVTPAKYDRHQSTHTRNTKA
jgi:hypothetical protein